MPISVVVPPRMLAKESGISSREGAIDSERASTMATGVKIATTGVLLMKAEMTMTRKAMAMRAAVGDRPPTRDTMLPARSTSPVRSRAALSTNSAATVIGPLLLNTPRASRALRMPLARSTLSATIATTSGVSRSRTKPRTTSTTNASTIAISTASVPIGRAAS